MTYPTIPLAYVTFLAEISEERSRLSAENAGLATKVTQVTVIAHHDKQVRSRRYAIQDNTPEHWTEMLMGAVGLFNEGEVDTMMVLFPTDSQEVDVGYLLEGGKEPRFYEWTYAPKFSLRLTSPAIEKQLAETAAGFETLKGLLDKQLGSRPALSPPKVNYGVIANTGR